MTGWRAMLQRVVADLRRLDAAVLGMARKGDRRNAPLSGDPVGLPGRLRRGLAFGSAARADTWELLADVTQAGVKIDTAVETMIETYRRPGRMGRALVLAEMRAGLLDGNVEKRLSPYVSGPERLLLGGIERQDAAGVFRGAGRLLRNRMVLRKALVEATAMPVLLGFLLLGLVLFFGLQLLPAFGEIVDFDTLPTLQRVTVGVTLAISEDPQALAWWIGGVIAGVCALMRLWTGPGRAMADRFPPFSVMRLQAGTGFLFSICEYGQAGVAVTPRLLERMARATGRYEASRIRALIGPLERTGNLGAAALEAGQGFPDNEMSAVLRVLWPRDKGVENAAKFLERRLERIESGVKARMAALNVILLVLVTVVLGLLLSVMMPILQQLNQVQQAVGV